MGRKSFVLVRWPVFARYRAFPSSSRSPISLSAKPRENWLIRFYFPRRRLSLAMVLVTAVTSSGYATKMQALALDSTRLERIAMSEVSRWLSPSLHCVAITLDILACTFACARERVTTCNAKFYFFLRPSIVIREPFFATIIRGESYASKLLKSQTTYSGHLYLINSPLFSFFLLLVRYKMCNTNSNDKVLTKIIKL